MGTITIRLPDLLERRLEALARRERTRKSTVARAAIEDFLGRRERERHMAALVREIGRQDGNVAIAMADEALEGDNEAFGIAESLPASETD